MSITKIKQKILQNDIAKKITGTFLLKVISALMSLVIGILLARIIGVEEYGIYSYVTTIIFFLSLPAGLGLKQILVKEVAKYDTQSLWGSIFRLLKISNYLVVASSVVVVALVVLLVQFGDKVLALDSIYILYAGLSLIPLTLLNSHRQAALQGLRYVVLGQLPELIIQPVLFIGFILIFYLMSSQSLNAGWTMLLKLLAVFISFVAGSIMLKKVLAIKSKNYFPNNSKMLSPLTELWNMADVIPVQSILPFMFIEGMHLISNKTDILMLGLLTNPVEVAVYTVVSRGSQLINFVLMSVNLSLAANISSYYVRNENSKIQSLANRSAKVTFLIAGLFTVGFVLFGKYFLLLFGKEYSVGYAALLILSIGQLLNMSSGLTGLLLNMTGHEKSTFKGVVLGSTINVILNYIFILNWGIEGAAIATASSSVIREIYLVLSVHRKLGIKPTIFKSI